MKGKGMKLLAIVAVLMMAFAVFVVITDKDSNEAAAVTTDIETDQGVSYSFTVPDGSSLVYNNKVVTGTTPNNAITSSPLSWNCFEGFGYFRLNVKFTGTGGVTGADNVTMVQTNDALKYCEDGTPGVNKNAGVKTMTYTIGAEGDVDLAAGDYWDVLIPQNGSSISFAYTYKNGDTPVGNTYNLVLDFTAVITNVDLSIVGTATGATTVKMAGAGWTYPDATTGLGFSGTLGKVSFIGNNGIIAASGTTDTDMVTAGFVAKVSGTAKYYTSQKDAIAVATANDTVSLLANWTITETTDIDLKGMTINAGTSTISASGSNVILTIKDSTATVAPSVGTDHKTVTYQSGKITGQSKYSTTQTGIVLRATNGAVIEVESGTVENTKDRPLCSIGANSEVKISGGYVKGVEAAVMAFDGAKVTVTGGVLHATDNFVVGTNGTEGRGGNAISISGGTFIGQIVSNNYIACGIYVANSDVVSVSGGTFYIHGGAGVVIRAGQVTLSGNVNITCTTDTTHVTTGTGWVGDNKNKLNCSPIMIDYQAAYPGLSSDYSVSVTGGTYVSDAPSITVYDDKDEPIANPTITGGSFTITGSSGTSLIAKLDGIRTLRTDFTTGLVTEYYTTVSKVVTSSIVGDVITLVTDATLDANAEIVAGKSFNIDGKTLTVPQSLTLTLGGDVNNDGTIVNNGTIFSSGDVTNSGILNNAGTIKFTGGTVTNSNTINNTGEIGFTTTMAPANPGETGLLTTGTAGKVAWYVGSATTPSYYIASGESGSFKMTGIYSGTTLTGIKTEFTAGSAIQAAVGNNANDIWTIASGVTVTVPQDDITLAGTVTNNGTLSVVGTANATVTLKLTNKIDNAGIININTYATLDSSTCTGEIGTKGVAGTGVLNVYDGGEFIMANATPVASVPTGQFLGTMNVYTGGKLAGITSGNKQLMTLTGENTYLQVVSKSSKTVRDVEYTLFGTGTVDDATAYSGAFFATGDKLVVAEGATLNVTALTLNAGVKLTINGTVSVPQTLVVKDSGAIVIGSEGALIGGGTVNFRDSSSNSIVISAAQGATLTVTLDGSTVTTSSTETKVSYSAIKVENIVAGAEGFTVTKGSVVIKGYYTTDDTGKITIPAKDELGNPNVAYISGSVDSGVVIDVAGEATLEVATGSSLTFEADSALVGKVTVPVGSGAEIVYEEGSVVNGAVIEVTTREKEGGVIEVTVIVTLRTENADKLMLYYEGEYCEVVFIEAFQGDKFVDILANVGVESLKSRVSFDGWYNVLNEKVVSSMEVGSVAPTLTAKFTETPREGVTPHTPSIEPTVITVDETSGYDNTTMLVAAVAMLVVAIFVLGYVVIVKRK